MRELACHSFFYWKGHNISSAYYRFSKINAEWMRSCVVLIL